MFKLETRAYRSWVRDYVRDVEKEAQPDVIERTTNLALSMLEDRTPVRSGRARAGWNADLVLNGVKSLNTGNYVTFPEDADGSPRFSASTDRRFKSFSTIFSRVPYIIRLEFGWSRQAPLGMIRVTFLELAARRVLASEMGKGLRKSAQRTNARHAGRRVRGR